MQGKGVDPANFVSYVPKAVEAGLDEAEELLLYREFVADAAREILRSLPEKTFDHSPADTKE